ncbi:MAG: DUF3536 domain-containing protein [Deltaproteobacteria bacterium]|nr:DUF3536 domain-containing protein [Deltaproteobacteria bacterium]
MSERYVCIHGHFYQPPRENPWLEHLEQQESAYPYHDWNERVTAECYAPNAAARILDQTGHITRINNNYARLSFNFGPTLLSWLAVKAPETYAAILAADRESQAHFDGHGSAIAQVYNHVIMPLANHRDKVTQVRWGVTDFTHRFGRAPEGMWLAETAVDLESLEIMAAHGIRFTILAPHQASHVRLIAGGAWQEVNEASLDSREPYLVVLPSGRTITVFFYDGATARAVAFEGLLQNGERFADRLLGCFDAGRAQAQLVHIATDGETYGHHHRFGEMALSYALHHVDRGRQARVTNYAAFLAKHPPRREARIRERTSWSCSHGVERWRADCGCRAGADAKWNQAWRKPLREALTWLQQELASVFEARARAVFVDPWRARDAYIDVILDRSPAAVTKLLTAEAKDGATADRTEALALLEMQRQALLMFTSCGWFFDDLAGIETLQLLSYAARALQLSTALTGTSLEADFVSRLAPAESNRPEQGNGQAIWERSIKPHVVRAEQVGAHYAIRSLFEPYREHDRVYCYHVDRNAHHLLESGRTRLQVGQVTVTSEVTEEKTKLCFGVLHFGDHNLSCGVHLFKSEREFDEMWQAARLAFDQGDLAAVIRHLDRHYDGLAYSLGSLFADQQRWILDSLLAATLASAEDAYRQLHDQYGPLARYLRRVGLPVPQAIKMAGEYVLDTTLKAAMAAGELDLEKISHLLDQAKDEAVPLDKAGLSYALGKAIERAIALLRLRPADLALLQQLCDAVGLARAAAFDVDLWRVQTLYWDLSQRAYPDFAKAADHGDDRSRRWVERFRALGEVLKIRVA